MSRSRGARRNEQIATRIRKKARNAPTCTCGKRSYPNEFAAAGAQAASGVGCRVYQCDHGPWHITSKPKRGNR